MPSRSISGCFKTVPKSATPRQISFCAVHPSMGRFAKHVLESATPAPSHAPKMATPNARSFAACAKSPVMR